MIEVFMVQCKSWSLLTSYNVSSQKFRDQFASGDHFERSRLFFLVV